MNTPVLFLIFNRPETTAEVFSVIKTVKPPRLYIAADGPREERKEEADLCNKTRAFVLNAIDWECEVHTLFRETNLGCGLAVSEAITWFFSQEEMGIILEDDCVPASSFFDFCEVLLYKYQYEERVMMISGLSFFSQNDIARFKSDYFVHRLGSIWGWASWKRAWAKYNFYIFDYDKNVYQLISNPFVRNHFNSMTERAIQSNSYTWDVQWTYAIMKNNGLTVSPLKNFIRNIGYVGTHADGEISPAQKLEVYEFGKSFEEIQFFEYDSPHLEFLYQKKIQLFLGGSINTTALIFGRLKRVLKRVAKLKSILFHRYV